MSLIDIFIFLCRISISLSFLCRASISLDNYVAHQYVSLLCRTPICQLTLSYFNMLAYCVVHRYLQLTLPYIDFFSLLCHTSISLYTFIDIFILLCHSSTSLNYSVAHQYLNLTVLDSNIYLETFINWLSLFQSDVSSFIEMSCSLSFAQSWILCWVLN